MVVTPVLVNFHEIELMALFYSMLSSRGLIMVDLFYNEWKLMVLAFGAVSIATLFLRRFFVSSRTVKCLAVASLTKCNVTSSRKRILVTIYYQYNIGENCYKAFEKIVRYPESYNEDYRSITRTVIAGFTREPLLEVFGSSSARLKSHSVKESIKRRVPELAQAKFGV